MAEKYKDVLQTALEIELLLTGQVTAKDVLLSTGMSDMSDEYIDRLEQAYNETAITLRRVREEMIRVKSAVNRVIASIDSNSEVEK